MIETDIVDIVGTAATGASLLVSLGGIPHQIYRTIKTGEHVSLPLALSTFTTYAFWASYGYLRGDVFIEVAQTPGVIGTATIVLLRVKIVLLTAKKYVDSLEVLIKSRRAKLEGER